MCTKKPESYSVAPVTDVVDGAEGVAKTHWYVAIVTHNAERQTSEKLGRLGVTSYVPTQREIRVWRNGRKSKVDRIVIPSIVFINCTEEKRREIIALPHITRFMTNKAGISKDSAVKPLAIVTDAEIDRLKFMVGQSDVPVYMTTRGYVRGDKVRVVRGSLKGLEGEVLEMNSSKTELMVDMDLLGYAKLIIDTVNLELIGSGR